MRFLYSNCREGLTEEKNIWEIFCQTVFGATNKIAAILKNYSISKQLHLKMERFCEERSGKGWYEQQRMGEKGRRCQRHGDKLVKGWK